MAANEAVTVEKNKKKKILITAAIILAVAAVGLGIAILIIITEGEGNPDPPASYLVDGKLGYDSAAIILDPNGFQQDADRLSQEVQDGYISLSHKGVAYSSDGVNFECYIQNNIDNKYDMFLNIYKDSSAQEQLLLSGLIPPGQGIDHFTSEIGLDPGEYKALLVITQVEDDHATLHGNQLFLTIDLIVGK